LHTERIIFVLSEPICVKWLHIRLRLESLDDTDEHTTPCLLILLVARRGC